jgi:alpha-galactosidase
MPRPAQVPFVTVRYTNEGSGPVEVASYTSHRYAFEPARQQKEPAFWSYQPASYEPARLGPACASGLSQENFLGMNASDYGGGTPVVDVWRRTPPRGRAASSSCPSSSRCP